MSKSPGKNGWKNGLERAAALLVFDEQGMTMNIDSVVDTLRAEGWQQPERTLWSMVIRAASVARKQAGLGNPARVIRSHKGGRIERLDARFTADEKSLIMRAAGVAGMSISDWIMTHQDIINRGNP